MCYFIIEPKGENALEVRGFHSLTAAMNSEMYLLKYIPSLGNKTSRRTSIDRQADAFKKEIKLHLPMSLIFAEKRFFFLFI